MATPEEIATLRLLIAETDEATYNDTVLGARLDAAAGNGNLVAYEVWTEKAAAAAQLVNTSEGGSSRSLGDIYEQALKMAATFAERATSPVTPPTATSQGLRIKRLVRP